MSSVPPTKAATEHRQNTAIYRRRSHATFQRQLIGAVAELERSLIRERQREGIDLAKARGAYKGRARRLTDEQIAHVREAAANGANKAKLAGELGVSRRLIYDVIAGNGAYGDFNTASEVSEPSDT